MQTLSFWVHKEDGVHGLLDYFHTITVPVDPTTDLEQGGVLVYHGTSYILGEPL